MQFDLGPVVGVEEDPVGGLHGSDVGADSHGDRPGEAVSDGSGRGDDDACAGPALAFGAFLPDQYAIVQQPDREALVQVVVRLAHVPERYRPRSACACRGVDARRYRRAMRRWGSPGHGTGPSVGGQC
ncbi:hypothetical protein GCM10022220_03020 [Actinocatenispora rupis]|uniref:Uncharacterized protein n=1 Tax=Actinocatenispora rupis TaxID=519421 RepID=A0A8J3NGU4_9ACTN|nr:hypothetical protein Aru02nite_72290 [Actinocatenispora rupis]